MQAQKGFSTLILVIIIVAVAVVAVGGVLAYQSFSPKTQPVVQTQQSQNQNQQQQTVNQQTNNVQPTNQTADWKTYANSQYGFELKYPSNFTFTDNSSFLLKNAKNLSTTSLFMATINFCSEKECPTLSSSAVILLSANYTLPQDCYKSSTGAESTKTSVKNGILFYVTEDDLNGVNYATIHNGFCYQLSLGDIGINGGSSQLNETEINQFNDIFSTFKFTK